MTPAEEDALEREQREREDRAYERGDHVDHAGDVAERRQRAREWDIALGNWIP